MGFQTWKPTETKDIPRTQALSDACDLEHWIREQTGTKSARYSKVQIRRIILFLKREAIKP